ncbi:ABC transporter permease [Rhabdochlamydiaceae symbiont of Dictyostelium giganteum]|uniref:ABC transporter permease n=1 Tax=Rhabdochlamydiaceae symbiont of Dictyostelium giganteum TaxID=3342349 RepID=UPI003850DCD8
MINLKRCWGIFLHYFYLFAKLEQIADLFYWPAIDIVLWGLTTVWIQHESGHTSNVALIVMTGLVFWQIVWRGNYEISINLLQEFWNRNLVNLFSTPLKLTEWMVGVLLLSTLKIFITIGFGALLVYLLYSLNIFSLGFAFLPFTALLMMSGWAIGFFAASIVIYWGQRLQMLAWMTAYIFAPFSAVYYPVSSLPASLHGIAWSLPTTYVFEGMRAILNGGAFPWTALCYSLGLNLFYLFLSMMTFSFAFEKSRTKGLSRFE